MCEDLVFGVCRDSDSVSWQGAEERYVWQKRRKVTVKEKAGRGF